MDRIICLFQIHDRPENIFPIYEILFTHLPYGKHILVHASFTLPKPTLLIPYISHSVTALTLLISTLAYMLPTTLYLLSCYIHICYPSLCTGALCKTPVHMYNPPCQNLRHSTTEIPPFFKHLTGNPSNPGALPDFIKLYQRIDTIELQTLSGVISYFPIVPNQN